MTGYTNHISADDIYKLLKEDILSLKLKPRQMISENEIASSYNVSRTPIKTAFMRLKGENYIDIVPQRGTFVTPLDMKYIKDAIYMRSVLEYDLLVNLMDTPSADEVAAILEENLNMQRSLVNSGNINPTGFYEVDNNFHLTFYDAMDRRGMWDIIQYCQVFYTRFRMLDAATTSRYQQLYQEHERILRAFKAKDAVGLKSAIFHHLHGALYILADRIDTELKDYFA